MRILSKDKFPKSIGGGLESDLTMEKRLPGTDKKWCVAIANRTRLKKSESEEFRLKLEELTGLKWERDSVSSHVFHYKGEPRKESVIMAKKDRLVVETKIKSCNVKSNGESLSFEGISLTEDQREKVIKWIKDKENGLLSFEPIQENLPGIS